MLTFIKKVIYFLYKKAEEKDLLSLDEFEVISLEENDNEDYLFMLSLRHHLRSVLIVGAFRLQIMELKIVLHAARFVTNTK